jgi:hypothetical protein
MFCYWIYSASVSSWFIDCSSYSMLFSELSSIQDYYVMGYICGASLFVSTYICLSSVQTILKLYYSCETSSIMLPSSWKTYLCDKAMDDWLGSKFSFPYSDWASYDSKLDSYSKLAQKTNPILLMYVLLAPNVSTTLISRNMKCFVSRSVSWRLCIPSRN